MQGIVITTSEFTKDFLRPCIESLPRDYPILIVSNNYEGVETFEGIETVHNEWDGYELGGIYQGNERFDAFVHLSDSCIIKRHDLFTRMFESPHSVYLCDGFFSHLGKYRRETLEKVGIPVIDNKLIGIHWENVWHQDYLKAEPEAVQFDPPLPVHTDVFTEIHGQTRMVLDNGYITKYKGTWSL